ncbi:secreted aspartic proteinase [Colletotrichum higginsianum]|nr:secreted aspartic proteinase [Colletotrichum higginsianum]
MLLRSVYAVAGTISLPIEVQKSPQLTHRATGVKDVTLVNNQSDMSDRYYGIKIDVGTPYQELSLALNTRSSDTWFPNFNPVKSSTFVNGSFGSIEVAYGDPTTIPSSVQKFHLDYFEDVFRIAGVRISKQRFGIPSKGPDGLPTGGLLSIGPNLQFGYGRNKPFNTIVDSLAAQGMGQTSSNGSVQAYGVNAADSIFTLDTANQYMRLRHSFVDPLLRDLGAINDGNDLYTAPCSKRDGPGSWDFHFGNATIKIPYKNLILDATVEENSDYCLVAILVTWKGQLVLGGK